MEVVMFLEVVMFNEKIVEQKENRHIVPTSYGYERKITIKGSDFFLHHIPTRRIKRDHALLRELGISNSNPEVPQYYECAPRMERL
jgi:hypothetical protein